MDIKDKTEDKTIIERLFSAGSHFGFTKSRRHPTAVPYIYGNKQGTDIIDLEKTEILLDTAKVAVREMALQNKTILFVGTKDEISAIVKNVAKNLELPYVTNRWIGGTFTNFSEIKKRIARLKDLMEQGESGKLEKKYTKKERVMIGREITKLTFNFGGIQDVERTPGMMIVVDPRHNFIAVNEAKTMNVPVVAITSSDYNLREVKYPILVNDSSQASVSLILDELATAIKEGKDKYVPAETKSDAKKNTITPA